MPYTLELNKSGPVCLECFEKGMEKLGAAAAELRLMFRGTVAIDKLDEEDPPSREASEGKG